MKGAQNKPANVQGRSTVEIDDYINILFFFTIDFIDFRKASIEITSAD